jgi:hypothetical protein
MAIVAMFEVRDMAAEKYDEVIRRLEAAGAGAPAGRLFHVSYGSPSGLQVIDVYDSPQSLESFGRTLMPILQELGIEATPRIEQAHNTIAGR